MEHMEVVGQLRRREVRLCRHHAAADVDTHRRGQERVLGGDDAADCCSQAEVRVRHQADGSGQDRQTRGPQCLLQGVVVELAGPRGQVRVYLVQHCSLPISVDTVATKQCARSGRLTDMRVEPELDPDARHEHPRSSAAAFQSERCVAARRAGGECRTLAFPRTKRALSHPSITGEEPPTRLERAHAGFGPAAASIWATGASWLGPRVLTPTRMVDKTVLGDRPGPSRSAPY